MMLLVLANAIINASFVYTHNQKKDQRRREIYYYIEVIPQPKI